METSHVNFSTSSGCDQRVQKLQQQIAVMRKEIKNLRQHADSAVREQRKSLAALQSVVASMKEDGRLKDAKTDSLRTDCTVTNQALEKGVIQTTPIGYIESCFSSKNGTPRQPTICSLSRAILKINKSIFNNPEHSLMGLDQYSHVWIIFVFHKNGHLSYKAKVKPPRLNGVKTGVFSTRTPHRPNAIGLTLAKLEIIKGDTVYLSGIDMIQGTPVLDIKPYIPDYDSPKGRRNPLDTVESANQDQAEPMAVVNDSEKKNTMKRDVLSELGKPNFRYLKSADEAKAAIKGVLSADPRSVYRRTRCQDQLFYFTLDTAHITCWFGEGFAEVLRIKAATTECSGSCA
ncbi:tRNA (adenine(37)-N6)-methyltransferase isoform X3 [Polyodon spathula]|uniref:tRNA (adenine(37)-N6)-methyltransferase isoform X3 n=1 Tax=Polyodon spathula TaxID=7913 RepID=UPI001B7E1FE5|nr:tRNA (adenine(37)-N6)-methyltransferase isoform X3 [Polyodon spathula]